MSTSCAAPGTAIGNLVYTDDGAGRVASRSGSLFLSAVPQAVTGATDDMDNRLLTWNLASGGTSFTYDANGTMLTAGSVAANSGGDPSVAAANVAAELNARGYGPAMAARIDDYLAQKGSALWREGLDIVYIEQYCLLYLMHVYSWFTWSQCIPD